MTTKPWVDAITTALDAASPTIKDVDTSLLAARTAFCAFTREEDSDREKWARDSLRQHWTGAENGFADHNVQVRWKVFLAGWEALAAALNGGK